MSVIKCDTQLQGIVWCYAVTDQNETILKAKYKKGQRCIIRQQQANPAKANVYAGGNALIGFLHEYDFAWVKEKRGAGAKIYTEILKVSDLEHFPNITVTIRMQTSPFVKKATVKSSKAATPTVECPTIIKKPRSPKIKHPITNKAFMAQKDLASVCRNLSGRTGIYCIYTKEFTTYIG